MAAHLVIIACLVAPPNTCKEVPLLDVTSEDVASCTGTAPVKAVEWQRENLDQFVIGTKCVKTE